ncbi:MAG: NYN domain-containing protein [Verrucomicrobiales bacterium]|nr:NYN domain-containing protein [Verrucomicrobiales bacterium]
MSKLEAEATMAVFLDLENIARGVQDARYPKFDIRKVLERLLLKGHIVVKKAYCDFERFKEFKRSLHEAAFELIEIPHLRLSGKNSADIRMVVDALDLCYTREHVDTFVILSGDSDFSPLVSKLRENARTVVGFGVKNSSSDLFINNCDEFIYYDDLVREAPRKTRRRRESGPASESVPATSAKSSKESLSGDKALDLVLETLEALSEERDEDERVWGSMIKQAIKRRNPGFNERAHGFRSFNELLKTAGEKGLVKLEADSKSGGYIVRALD